MRKSIPAENPDAYVASLNGWQRDCVVQLRAAVRKTRGLDETVKWGHLVYLSNGPVCLIRAEDTRVLFGFWRGQRLQTLEPRLKSGGKYEMATIEITADAMINAAMALKLVKRAVELNAALGNPAVPAAAKSKAAPKKVVKKVVNKITPKKAGVTSARQRKPSRSRA